MREIDIKTLITTLEDLSTVQKINLVDWFKYRNTIIKLKRELTSLLTKENV